MIQNLASYPGLPKFFNVTARKFFLAVTLKNIGRSGYEANETQEYF